MILAYKLGFGAHLSPQLCVLDFNKMGKIRHLNRTIALASVPVRNQVQVEDRDDGTVILTLTAKYRGILKLLQWIFVLPQRRILELDAIGKFIWNSCDGKNTVAQLTEKIVTEFKLNRKEAEVSLLEYLKRLVQRGVLGMLVPMDKVEIDKRNK